MLTAADYHALLYMLITSSGLLSRLPPSSPFCAKRCCRSSCCTTTSPGYSPPYSGSLNCGSLQPSKDSKIGRIRSIGDSNLCGVSESDRLFVCMLTPRYIFDLSSSLPLAAQCHLG
ncbi:unnamed protein product [Pleuronectes platessa]|uniref:Uncharacterized protein n=1 Tax=Pleuronectes platessa TaxID=8262 RepID=A0A9N7VFJ6_PLEPL|nr:unnamed protein product [Pleuronectes platessa]